MLSLTLTFADAVSLGSRISSSQRPSSRSSRRQSYESSMSQKLSDIEREIREVERRKRRRKRRKKRQNRIQPILEPISSNMAALQAHRMKHTKGPAGPVRVSSDISRTSAQPLDMGMDKIFLPKQSLGSSNILSDSVITGNSISELELPEAIEKLPDFSMFAADAALPPTANKEENMGDNSNGNMSNLKGAKSSPSGSIRRGRRREVKLEMTETSFYQEDEDNIGMGGNQTIHAEENCHETGEIRGNLKELGPLMNEIFEHARVSSRNSGRDPMGNSRIGSASSRASGRLGSASSRASGRLGSASSRGSRGSKGSQSNPKDLIKYATAKVHLPPEVPRNDTDRTDRKRPFSGNYVLDHRRNSAKRDEGVRKSQSQPVSRVSSAAGHKRQIGNNGRLDFGDGLSWSRFLQNKGHVPGQLFSPQTFDKNQMHFCNEPLVFDAGQGPYPGQLQIMDKSHVETRDNMERRNADQNQPYEMQRPYTNPYRKYETTGDVLPDEAEEAEGEDSGISSRLSQNHNIQGVNILNVEAEHCRHCGAHKTYAQDVDVLNIQAEQTRNDKNAAAEYRKHSRYKHSPPEKTEFENDRRTHKGCHQQGSADVLDIEAERAKQNIEGVTNNTEDEHLDQARQGDVLANVSEDNATCSKTDSKQNAGFQSNQQPSRPHTGPSPAHDEQRRVTCKHEFASAFSGKGQKVAGIPNKTKTIAALNSNVKNSDVNCQPVSNSVPVATANALSLEQQRELLKQRKLKLGSQGSLSSGSRSGSRSTSANTGSAASRNSRSRLLQQNNVPASELNKTFLNNKSKVNNPKPATGIERNLGMFDFVDYEEFNSEYDDVTTDDLTDTYTYTDYDDDLTEVSSLPC